MTQPATTVTGLARRYAVEIDTAAPSTAIWVPLIGIEEFKPSRDQRRENDEDYADAGAARETITGSSWKLDVKLIHRAGADGFTFDTTQEYLRAKAEATDPINGEVHVRWFDRSGVGEAYEGRALVSWAPDGGNGGARDTVAVVLSGQGARAAITNPNGSALPVVFALAPTGGGTAGGAIVEIHGRKLTGATAVTFGGTNPTSFRVVSDNLIIAVCPAKTASTVDVLVTTPSGTSANTANDNFIYS